MYASIESIYKETGWEKLKVRREFKKVTLFYKIVNNQAPEYLSDVLPPTISEITNYNLRQRQNIMVPLNRISVYQHSYFPSCIKLWNSLDVSIRQLPTFSSFKTKIRQLYLKNKKPPSYFGYGDRLLSVLHARLRNKCSTLNSDLCHANLIQSANCLCGYINENAEHFLLYCSLFNEERIQMYNEINWLNLSDLPISTELLLFGNEAISLDNNCAIFMCVQKYIKDCKRFLYR